MSLRIAHLLQHVRRLGTGMVNVAVDLAILQARDGHEVAVVSSGGEYEELLAKSGVQVVTTTPHRGPAGLPGYVFDLRTQLARLRPQIVHAHMIREAGLAWALRPILGYSTVCTVHNEFQHGSLVMALGDRVIAVSEAVRASLVARRFPSAKLRVVRNGNIGSPRAAWDRGGASRSRSLSRPAIVTVAGMYQRKGIGELIEAFLLIADDVPEAGLYLVGDGPDRSLFEEQASRSDHGDRISFEGFCADPTGYFDEADVFVLASHVDASPLVIPEARAAGCAIVASDVDGIPEALDQGAAGVLVPSHDSKALAERLKALLLDENVRCRWQRAARSNLDWLRVERVHQETMNVYRELRSNSDQRGQDREARR